MVTQLPDNPSTAVPSSPTSPPLRPWRTVHDLSEEPVVELEGSQLLVDGVPLIDELDPCLYESGGRGGNPSGGMMLGVNFALKDKALAEALAGTASWRERAKLTSVASLRKVALFREPGSLPTRGVGCGRRGAGGRSMTGAIGAKPFSWSWDGRGYLARRWRTRRQEMFCA